MDSKSQYYPVMGDVVRFASDKSGANFYVAETRDDGLIVYELSKRLARSDAVIPVDRVDSRVPETADVRALEMQIRELEAKNAKLVRDITAAIEEAERLGQELAQEKALREACTARSAEQVAEIAALNTENNKLAKVLSAMTAERDTVLSAHNLAIYGDAALGVNAPYSNLPIPKGNVVFLCAEPPISNTDAVEFDSIEKLCVLAWTDTNKPPITFVLGKVVGTASIDSAGQFTWENAK